LSAVAAVRQAAMRYAAVLALGAVALAGCGGSGSTTTATTLTTAPTTATTPKPAPSGGSSRVEEIESELRLARESLTRKITPAKRHHIEAEISKLERERSEA